jgi:hypothetical protein
MVSETDHTHLRDKVTSAAFETDPGPHMVVSNLLPPHLYTLLLETMPPPEGFDVADESKANFDPESSTIAPQRSRDTWLQFQREVVDGALTPLLVERFKPHLTALYERLFGSAFADDAMRMHQHAFRGRLMLRRPGYRLRPHRDTKIATITGLMYFARPGDNADYGTDIYRIDNDQPAPSMKTFYPEAHGGHAELVKWIPFIGNSALFFLNAPGMAHAAGIPRKSSQTERYAYQFYVGPPEPDLGRIVSRMPSEQAATWAGVQMPQDGY